MLYKAVEWASVSIGTLLLGNMEGLSFLRAFERRENNLFRGILMRSLKDMYKRAL
jgi:hypothetical protein